LTRAFHPPFLNHVHEFDSAEQDARAPKGF
jgi:hypothetical protein